MNLSQLSGNAFILANKQCPFPLSHGKAAGQHQLSDGFPGGLVPDIYCYSCVYATVHYHVDVSLHGCVTDKLQHTATGHIH